MFHNFQIKEGAFLLSDVHYSPQQRPAFLAFLQAIKEKKLQPTQLILMGDIFDALFGGIPKSYEPNQEAITLLNELSLEIEVLYLEGNHDFNLAKIFPHAMVVPLQKQPIACSYATKKILLAHGDFASGMGYKIYTTFIRNTFVLGVLNLINSLGNNFILKKLDEYLSKKDDCKEIENFEQIVVKRLDKTMACDYFIEGHFHQNRHFLFKDYAYVNLGAFACNQRYFVVKSSQEVELLEEKLFS
jgi:UDP-2,3-diacylglucosamine hydrolase